jgi:hypothetical protein
LRTIHFRVRKIQCGREALHDEHWCARPAFDYININITSILD